MRAREFLNLLIKESKFTSIESDLDMLSQAAQDPKVAKTVNAGLNQILTFAKKAASQTNIDQPMQEDIATDKLIAEIENTIKAIPDPKVVEQLRKQISNLKASVKNSERVASDTGFKQGVQHSRQLSIEIKSLVGKLEQLPDNLKNLVTKALNSEIFDNSEMFEPIKQFLIKCGSPERYLDLPKLIETESSGIITTDPVIQKIATILAGVMPQGKRSATGRGEVLLLMMGKGAFKPAVGDLAVNINGEDRVLEVKASDSQTDWTLATNPMKVEDARTILVNTINKFSKKPVFLDAPAQTIEHRPEAGTITGISGISKDTLPILNPIFQQMGAAATQQMFTKMLVAAAGKEFEEMAQSVSNTITDKGMDPNLMLPALRKFQFDWYMIKNKHYALLSMNAANLKFSIAKTSDKFVQDPTVSSTKIFDFRKNPGAIITFKQR